MRLAFIVCSGRSGSTLLASMLNMHDDIHVPVELIGLYSSLPSRLKYYGDLRSSRNRELLGQDLQQVGQLNELSVSFDGSRFADLLGRTDGTLGSVLRCFYETLLPDGKNLLVDKTPSSSIYHRQMSMHFPEARFVHLVRDGRDVSLSSMRGRKGLNNPNIYESAVLWSRVNLQLAAFGLAEPARYLRVRYEDLVANPQRELAAVCAFLSEPYSDSLLEFASGEFAKRNAEVLDHHANLRREVMRGNVDKWRAEMSPGDVELFEILAGRALRECGYPCQPRRRLSLRSSWRMLRSWTLTQLKRPLRLLRTIRVETTVRLAVPTKRIRSFLRA